MENTNFQVKYFAQKAEDEKIYVRIDFNVALIERTVTRLIPLSDINSKKLSSHIPEGFCIPGLTHKAMLTKILEGVEQVQQSGAEVMFTLVSPGYTYIDERWVYGWGDKVINGLDRHVTLSVTHSTENLVASNEYWEWLTTYINQGQDKACLLLCAITPYLSPLTEKLSLSNNTANALLVGPSGCGKTSYAKLLAQLPDGAVAGVNLGSDTTALYSELSKYRNQTVLIDDLSISSSAREQDRRLTKLSGLLQYTSSAGTKTARGTDVSLESDSLIITAEYSPKAAATINRCVLILADSEPNWEELGYLQENKKLFVSFLHDLITWLAFNCDELAERILSQDNSTFECYGYEIGPSRSYIGYSRIVANYKLLSLTSRILLSFLRSRGMEDTTAKKIYKRLSKALDKSIKDTLDAVHVKEELSPIVTLTLKLLCENPDKIFATSVKKYVEAKEKKIFFAYNDKIYFRGVDLLLYIEAKFCSDIGPKKLSSDLIKHNLLVTNGKEYTGKLPKKLRDKYNSVRLKGRFIALDYNRTLELIYSQYPNENEREKCPLEKIDK